MSVDILFFSYCCTHVDSEQLQCHFWLATTQKQTYPKLPMLMRFREGDVLFPVKSR